jgi:hypothetical protein
MSRDRTNHVRNRFQQTLREAFVLAAYALCAFASCQHPSTVRGWEVPLQIELDAFSGRPNPRWELTQAQAAEFLKLLRALQPAQMSHSMGDGLGYRGFIVSANGGPVDGYGEIRVYRGTVLVRRGDRTEALSDPQQILERWLLRSARGHVAEAVLQYIQSEIGPR